MSWRSGRAPPAALAGGAAADAGIDVSYAIYCNSSTYW